jgi:peroxiredoxin
MSKVELNTPAPDFTLTDFNGNKVSLSDFRGRKNVLLVFNRGFF